jgi:hypothetical protein
MKIRHSVSAFLSICTTILATQVCAQNILLNGSFETPNLTGTSPNGQGYIGLSINPGSTNLTGWTVSNYEPALIRGQWYSAYPEDGNQFIVLSPGDQPAGTVIAQSFGTTPGFSYSVSFWQAQSGATIQVHQILSQAISSSGVTLASLQVSPAMAINVWQMHDYIFTASSTNTTLSFTETIAGNKPGTQEAPSRHLPLSIADCPNQGHLETYELDTPKPSTISAPLPPSLFELRRGSHVSTTTTGRSHPACRAVVLTEADLSRHSSGRSDGGSPPSLKFPMYLGQQLLPRRPTAPMFQSQFSEKSIHKPDEPRVCCDY